MIDIIDIIEKIFTWGIPLLVIFFVFRSKGAHNELKDVFQTLATESGGTLTRSDDIRYPILTVNKHGCAFSLTNGLAAGGDVWVTKLHLDNAMNQPFHLRIQPTDALEEFSKKLGFQDVELGNAQFDKLYLVKTKDAQQARALVDAELQKLLVSLRDLRPEVWITDTYISVTTQMQHELPAYRRLLKLGAKLCEIRQKI